MKPLSLFLLYRLDFSVQSAIIGMTVWVDYPKNKMGLHPKQIEQSSKQIGQGPKGDCYGKLHHWIVSQL